MELKPEQKLDALKFLSETHRNQFKERRGHEWKPIYSTSLFFILTIYTILKYSQYEYKWYHFIPFLIMSVVLIVYTLQSGRANNLNKTYAEISEDLIVELLKGNDVLDAKKNEETQNIIKTYSDIKATHYLSNWGIICHMAFAISILLILYFVMFEIR